MPLPAPTLLLFLPLLVTLTAAVPTPVEDPTHLLAFKSKADLTDSLPYSANSSASYCTWTGVQCTFNHRATKLVLQNLPLNGIVPPNTVSLLDQLRVLSLQNLSLSGPIPDLSTLPNLKALFLDHNRFTFSVPSSLVSLHRLKTLDLSYNLLSGDLPASLVSLRRLTTLDLRFNHFAGALPAFNQSSLAAFNVSHNNFSGPVPVTPALLRFGASSFRSNPSLCGEIVHRECRPVSPFFAASPPDLAPPPESGGHTSGELRGVGGLDSHLDSDKKSRKKKTKALIIGFCSSVGVLILSLFCYITSLRRKSPRHRNPHSPARSVASVAADDTAVAPELTQMELQGSELEEKVKQRLQQRQRETAPEMVAIGVMKSGRLLFCAGEAQLYTLDQLMRASAELLGRGTLGTTYKAVLDNRLIVTVKRLDAGKLRSTCGEVFERHMESVGGLRHPNLVPLRAYFQGKEERLLVYDYHPNGSLLSLIHGSKSNRAKPLHWTSCLKIAEDIAQGLSYIHQAWRLVHGNLKSSNVLLGPDFEACVSDYCVTVLAQYPHGADHLDPDAAAYRAPEITSTAHDQPTSKSDVYSFGILLLELVTGKPPSQLPDLAPGEMVKWVRFVREEGDAGGEGGGNDPLEMLLEVAMACSLASPEQRPTMWQVLKMLQEVKEAVVLDDSEVSILEQRDNSTGLS